MVEAVKVYEVQVNRDGKFWLVRIPEIDRATQALRYKDVKPMAKELIEIMTGRTRDSYDLQVTVRLPAVVEDHLKHAEVLREQAARAGAAAAKESRLAVKKLIAEGLSQREAAEVLHMSFQRVNQLVNS